MKEAKKKRTFLSKKSIITILFIFAALFILDQFIKYPAHVLVKLQADDIEKAVLHQDGYHSCLYGSWEIGEKETEEVFALVQAAARSVTENHSPQSFVHNVIESGLQLLPRGGPGRGPILSFVTKAGHEIRVGLWYESLELNGRILLADIDLCNAVEEFNLEQVNLRTDEIAAEKARIETISVSDITAMSIGLAGDKTYIPTPEESEEILHNLSQSLATNNITDEKEWRVENYVSYYVYQFLYYKKTGNEIPVYLECSDGETFVAEVGEDVVILNDLPYRVEPEINAALYRRCCEIYDEK